MIRHKSLDNKYPVPVLNNIKKSYELKVGGSACDVSSYAVYSLLSFHPITGEPLLPRFIIWDSKSIKWTKLI